MAQGDKVKVGVYNTIQSTIAPVLGTGSGTTGYGQTVSSSQLSSPGTSTKITTGQWNALRNDILTCYNHQNSVNGSLTIPTLSTKVSAQLASDYQTMATNCVTNKDNFYSGYATLSSSTQTDQAANTWGPTGSNTWKITYRLTWSNADSARYFFNAGGQVRFNAAAATGIADGPPTDNTTKNYAWYSTLNQMGTIVFDNYSTYTLAGAYSPGTGSSYGYSNTQSLGQGNLLYTKLTSTYTPNAYRIYLDPGASSLTFYVEFEDLSVSANQTVYTYDPYGQSFGPYGVDEFITVQCSNYIKLYYASGTGQVDVSSYLPTVSVLSSQVIASPSP